MSVQVSGDKITFSDSSVLGSAWTGFKNRIINGAMSVNQYVSVPSGLGYPADRFNTYGTQAGKISTGQNLNSIAPPVGFQSYVGIQSSSAFTPASSDYFGFGQPIEANNISDFNFGTANAVTVTLSFLVRSSLTGTFSGTFINYAATRSYPFTFVINASDTWEKKSITIAGDTGGTWVLSGNGGGCKVLFDLGSGSTYRGTANTWASTFYNGATGSINLVGTSGATFYVTGIQFEKGSTATSFDYRPFGTELALCQRYYQKSYAYATAPASVTFTGMEWMTLGASGRIANTCHLIQSMRDTPSITPYDQAGTASRVRTSAGNGQTGYNIQTVSTEKFVMDYNASITELLYHWTASAEL